MTDEVKSYRVLSKLHKDFVINIKTVYVFGEKSKNAFLITNKDEVYSIGNNESGLLGLGHDENVRQPLVVPEISGKEIIDFANGESHVIALSKNGRVYCWGLNNLGQLGNGTRDIKKKNFTFHKPILNENLLEEHIVQICCGIDHTMILTENGEVFTWGYCAWGRLGNEVDYEEEYEVEPYKVTRFNLEKVQSISCGYAHSIALTKSGRVFSWGYNEYGQLGNESTEHEIIPKLMKVQNMDQNSNIMNFKKICGGFGHTVLLTTDGYINFCGSFHSCECPTCDEKKELSPFKFESSIKFDDIASHYNNKILIGISEDVCYIWGDINGEICTGPKKTHFKSFNDIFSYYFAITYEMLNLKASDTHTLSQKVSQYTTKGRYQHEFKELKLIGIGGFGKVYKVINSFDGQTYAMKVFSFEGKNEQYKQKCFEELKVMAKLGSDHIVQYKSSWIENNEKLYIQMELCESNLSQILEQKQNEFSREDFDQMNPIEYYISSELFKELLSGVNYLHQFKPPIIHRDLKPENILISNGVNGRFIKIADFGLVTFHASDNESHTNDVGTAKYTAPEVIFGRKYDIKADIYSLGFIMSQVFDIDIYSYSGEVSTETLIMTKYKNVRELIEVMMSRNKEERPSCLDLLQKANSWTISSGDLRSNADYKIMEEKLSACHSIEENFFHHFIKTKLKFD